MLPLVVQICVPIVHGSWFGELLFSHGNFQTHVSKLQQLTWRAWWFCYLMQKQLAQLKDKIKQKTSDALLTVREYRILGTLVALALALQHKMKHSLLQTSKQTVPTVCWNDYSTLLQFNTTEKKVVDCRIQSKLLSTFVAEIKTHLSCVKQL